MNEANITTNEVGSPQVEKSKPVSRKNLYTEAWAEPMLVVAKRYGVSSSFLKRVCKQLNIPTPPAGYWAMHAAGKAPKQPHLPEVMPGGELEWSRIGEDRHAPLTFSKAANSQARKQRARNKAERPSLHPILDGARAHFEASWDTDHGYLHPRKKILVDLVISRPSLLRTLEVANALFLELWDRGRQVLMPPNSDFFRRDTPDLWQNGHPEQCERDAWCPMRPTMAYVGEVSIGLTIFEMGEEVEVKWRDGKYVRVEETTTIRRKVASGYHSWVHKQHLPSGRLCIRAYSPYRGSNWSRTWCENKPGEIEGRIPGIAKALMRDIPTIKAQAEEAHRLAEIERERWNRQMEEWERERAERRRLQALKDSRAELDAIIAAWAEAQKAEAFFEDVLQRVKTKGEEERTLIAGRVVRARELLGGVDALARFQKWKAPEER